MTLSNILQSSNTIDLGQNLNWLQDLRRVGETQFTELGLPTPKIEDWKYTNLSSLSDTLLRPTVELDGKSSIDVLPSIFKEGSPGARLVFVNGQHRTDLSTPDSLPYGVTLEPISHIVTRDPEFLERHICKIASLESRAMLSLNNAAMNSGFVLHVSQNVVIDSPVEVIFIGGTSDDQLACSPRNLIILDDGAQADIVIHHVGIGNTPYFVNSVNEVQLHATSKLRVYNIQEDNASATNVSANYVNVAKDARYSSFNLSLGARISRYESYVSLSQQGSDCKLDGAYLMRGNGHCDNTLQVDHTVPNTSSDVMFKGVLDDHSRAVFQGKIVVHRDAQHTDGQMSNKTMLLSDNAEIDTKPELEIYADDVKCSHGAASGHVDEQALFYMRSRGIPDARARNLLIQSFLADAVERITVDLIREGIMDKVLAWMPDASNDKQDRVGE